MSQVDNLRPIERVILRLRDENVSTPGIARRIGKKPGTVERILQMMEYKKGRPPRPPRDDGLRPLERVILRLREEGESYGKIGNRLGRCGAQIRRIEGYAVFKGSNS